MLLSRVGSSHRSSRRVTLGHRKLLSSKISHGWGDSTRATLMHLFRELDAATAETLTGDYWTQTLVSALETQQARAPAALAFRAAQVILGARALFSDQLLQNLLDSPQSAGRTAREAHHLFPTSWLRSHKTIDRRSINQVANLADAGWHENTTISGQSPPVYVPRLRDQHGIGEN